DFRYLSGAGFKSFFFFWCHLLGLVIFFLFYLSFALSISTQCLIEMLPLQFLVTIFRSFASFKNSSEIFFQSIG
ncbi:MAG: hypothetical protein ACK47L_09765, partial [Pseudanabaena sp.]